MGPHKAHRAAWALLAALLLLSPGGMAGEPEPYGAEAPAAEAAAAGAAAAPPQAAAAAAAAGPMPGLKPGSGGSDGGRPPRWADAEADALARMAEGRPARMLVTYKIPESEVEAEAAAALPAEAAAAGPPRGDARPAAAAAAAAARRGQLAAARGRLRAAAARRVFSGGGGAARGGAALARDFAHVPVSIASVPSAAALAALRADPDVLSVEPDRALQIMGRAPPRDHPIHDLYAGGAAGARRGRRLSLMKDSLPLIRQPEVAAAGFTGAGCAVAVLDTGVDFTHADFGACDAAGPPGGAGCRVAFAKDFTPSDDGAADDDGHGSNVAAIVARVAPGAIILSLDVFQRPWAYDSDILAALDWVLANRVAYNICAANLSFGGGGPYESTCGTLAVPRALDALRKAGVVPVVAAGNDMQPGGLAYPACGPAAVSVGAVYDIAGGARRWGRDKVCTDAVVTEDQVACFSNSASYLTLLAPGVSIDALHHATYLTLLAPGVSSDAAGFLYSGTSQATPHVAGAVAVLKAAVPTAWPDEIVSALIATGRSVTDARNGVTQPRLDLAAALERLRGTVDLSPPVVTGLGLSSGSQWTRTQQVSLRVAATDAAGVAAACLSEAPAPTCEAAGGAWEAYRPTMAFKLSPGDGVKTVYVWLRDAKGFATPEAAAVNVTLDTAPPTGAALEINGGADWASSADVLLSISGEDASGFRACVTPAPAAGCATAAQFEAHAPGVPRPYSFPAASGDGEKTLYLFLRDPAGNVNDPPARASITLDARPPALPELRINGGDALTRSRHVLLDLSSAADAPGGSGLADMMICNEAPAAGCGEWVRYAPDVAWALPPGEGRRAVYAFLRDVRGNTMTAPAEAWIDLDGSPPHAAAVAVVGAALPLAGGGDGGLPRVGDRNVELAISGDDFSRVADYCAVNGPPPGDGPPPACGGGWVPLGGGGRVRWALADGPDGPRTVYVYLRDSLLNAMTSPAAASVLLDTSGGGGNGTADAGGGGGGNGTVDGGGGGGGPPQEGDAAARIVVNGGRRATAARTVDLAVAPAAADAGRVAEMCVTEKAGATAESCSPWRPFSPAASLQLSSKRGPKTLRAFFRAGGVGGAPPEPAAALVVYDTAAPRMKARRVALTGALEAGGGAVALSWDASGASDGVKGSGVAGFLLTYKKGGPPPPRCAAAPATAGVAAVPPAPAGVSAASVNGAAGMGEGWARVEGLEAGSAYGFRLCAVDAAGNVAAGVVWALKAP
ncbi:MAG: hypothetical protein J3K34DRAFT_522648 [Monoraphidium minutum]|nr:MAG: hypothetical protein J3K34DRAFT_522648 [Monoraphidium minutum]